jgi:hypothetical protein
VEREGRWCCQRGARKCRGEGTATTLRAPRLSMADAAAPSSSMVRASEKASREARQGELGVSTLSARKGQGTWSTQPRMEGLEQLSSPFSPSAEPAPTGVTH